MLIENLQSIFPGLDRQAVELIKEQGKIKVFQSGEPLIDAGQYFRSTMLVLEGKVKVYRNDDEGNEHLLYYLEQGQACALSMICAAKHERSELQAIALTQATILMIPLALMDELMVNNRSWYYFVLSSYRDRFEELLQMVDQIAFKGLDERLAYYLTKRKGSVGNKITITHEEIARDLSSSRVVISRLLKQLEQQGMVRLHRNEIEFLPSFSFAL